ncbi:multidrug effflux MFS transporter (plasmid) [Rhizobium johnstonii]|uniref:multidrug effflux MFS transporter n=1 Tax=Rhizobium leguminosarum TaxID=384 RepID=UPI00103AC66B|nr:multidrug effflux MFS transporter [Rhizobium leguminosarum]MBY5393226.1 multidrug effflux MFS transporter [Rhizobium leguminosarum]TBZ85588.1 Bcr/CflA family efflux MFS transporter [Rhizobium leguminosarum bv. viciae]WSG98170.1 multidrug effflux MFS transporter [Rhizobium johnstonii]
MRHDVDAITAEPRPSSTVSEMWLMTVLGMLLAFASISTDLYLPAMPGMSAALGTTQGSLQYTVSAYLIGFSFGQLIWGPVGDRFGRRVPVAVGLVLFMAGCTGCALSADVVQLIAFRVLQAVGACAGVVLARAMVRDLYGRDRAAAVLSTLMTVMAVAPLLGPSVGGLILGVAPWQAIFWALVGIGLLTLVALFTIPETLPAERRSNESLGMAFASYGGLILDNRLMVYGGALGFYYAGVFAGISSSSFAYIDYHHLSPQLFGAVFAVGTVGLMATNFANARLVARYGSDRMLKLGAAGAAVSGLVLAFVTATDFWGVYGMAASLWLFTAMNGLVTANAISGALADFPTRAGAVSALMGAIQYGSGVVGSAVTGTFANGTPWPMGVVIAIGGLGSLACASLIRRQSLDY